MSKIVNSEGKLFGKINLLDFLVLFVLLIALIGVGYKFIFVDKTDFTPEYSEGYITFKLSELLEHERDEIVEGDILRVPQVQEFGEIVEISEVPTKLSYYHTDGNVYTVTSPLTYDVYVKVQTDLLYKKDDFYYIDKGYKIVPNMLLDVSDGVLPCKGIIDKIELK